jgi:protein-S-isoprenylcysteine O-methyltransferase Ste14
MTRTRLIVQTTLWVAAMGALLFVPAGTLIWPGAWVFLAEIWVLGLAVGFWLLRYDPALLKERTGGFVQRDQPPVDKLLVVSLIVVYVAWLVLMGFDRRYLWSSVPISLQVIGAIGVFLSIYIGYLTFRENSFASPAVKIQTERAHSVVTTGPYRYVRHPMYAGALFHFAGLPLLLGSWWGLVALPLFVALFTIRIAIEEKTLRAALPGYDDYAARVRYRVIPLIW